MLAFSPPRFYPARIRQKGEKGGTTSATSRESRLRARTGRCIFLGVEVVLFWHFEMNDERSKVDEIVIEELDGMRNQSCSRIGDAWIWPRLLRFDARTRGYAE
jgi:hypothetical protein